MLQNFLNWITDNSVRFYVIAALVTLLGTILAYLSIEPAPDNHIVISAGREDGAYYQYAQQYAKSLAVEGVELEVLASNGSLENLQRLRDPGSDVDLAFVQGGVSKASDAKTLVSLASLYYEPLWFFYRMEVADEIDNLAIMEGHRLAIGGEGSGTKAIVSQLLAENGLAVTAQATLSIGGSDAADELIEGRIEGAFFVASPTSPTLQRLFTQTNVRLMSFERAGAYAMRYRFLSQVQLPHGALDLKRDIPHQDIKMVATTANLVARKTLHPALVDLLLATATRVHGHGGMFERRSQFPSQDYVDLPISEEAERYLSHGPSLLERYLPFWAATLIDRFKVMLVPFLVLFVPLFKILPAFFIWRIRSSIFRWYRELARVERQADKGSREARQAAIARLDEIDAVLRTMQVPVAFSQDLYTLRHHVDILRVKICRTDG